MSIIARLRPPSLVIAAIALLLAAAQAAPAALDRGDTAWMLTSTAR